MDYSYTKALRKLLYILYKLDLNDEVHASSMATSIMKRVEKQIQWEENDRARQRILEKYGHITPSEH
jgi:hypothetical protein